MPLFCFQKWIYLCHISQIANFWFSSHTFWRSSCNSKISMFGAAMLDNTYVSPTWASHTKLSLILKFLNYSYFTKMATRKPSPKMATWLTWPISIHLWSQKSGICYLKGVLWSRDVTWKPRIGIDSLFTGIMTPVKCLFALEMNWMH